MNLIERLKTGYQKLFPHYHDYRHVDTIHHSSRQYPLSADPATAKIYRCQCGKEYRRLTPAGEQQVFGFHDDLWEVLGYTSQAEMEKAEA